jgi:pyridoxal phosphate enzyme (YggS family)
LQLRNKTARKTRFFNSLLIEERLYSSYSNVMEKLDIVLRNIAVSRSKSALAADEVVILAASKGQDTLTIECFIKAGLRNFGENRVQGAAAKWGGIKKTHPDVTLHLIGPLQTNKVSEALALFDVIQTLDRPKLVDELAKHPSAKGKQFYIQVNTGEESQKAGVAPSEAASLISLAREKGLNVVGLMCIPPADQMPAPHFALLRKLAVENGLKELSMGMSGDYETAVRMGSTCVRIGTALFGERH